MIQAFQNFTSILVLAGLSLEGFFSGNWIASVMSVLVGASVIYMNIRSGKLKSAQEKEIMQNISVNLTKSG